MHFVNSQTFKKYFVPGIVFQSVVIAGGYGTGRELVEFFLNFGTLGGFIGMVAIAGLVWSIVCVATFEFARVFKAYDYRTFFTKLLGKAWWLYEVCYIVLLFIVLAVIASSAGTILNELFGLDYYIGVTGMMLGVGILVLAGSDTIEKVLSYWSFLLYAMYISFLVLVFLKFGDNISSSMATATIGKGWVLGGFKYSFYNLGIIPAVLFSLRHLETRKEAIGAGIIAGIIGIIPGILLFVAMTGFYPEILSVSVPVVEMWAALDTPIMQYGFQLVLFGTLIETGTGFIFAVTERVASVYSEQNKKVPTGLIFSVTGALLFLGTFVAQFGLIDLIAKGYGTITWGFFFLYVVPILTWGMVKIAIQPKKVGLLAKTNRRQYIKR